MLGRLIPFGYAGRDSYTRLQTLMADPQTIIIETRFTPYAPYRPEFCRWGSKGLFAAFDPRYYWFSEKSYGGGGDDVRNWLGNVNYKQPELGIELVNAERGILFVRRGLAQGKNVILLCGCRDYETCHRRIICELVRAQVPEVEIILPVKGVV